MSRRMTSVTHFQTTNINNMHLCSQSIYHIITIFSFVFLVICSLQIKFSYYLQCSPTVILNNTSSTSIIISNLSTNKEDTTTDIDNLSILCMNMRYQFDIEQFFPTSPVIMAPSFNSSQLFRFPYRYSHWTSSSIYPRLLTQCEHHLLMNLLIIIDRLCRQHRITYFITGGTLLGSLRHHDIIPWDDDMDIIISYQQRKTFLNAYKQLNQTLLGVMRMRRDERIQDYYKIFYQNTPNAGDNPWHFPFVDIFFYTQNETHLINLEEPQLDIKVKDVFPLILRPLGQLWIPTPNRPRRFFQFNPFDQCITHYWNHRNEIEVESFTIKCNELKDTYPFVQTINKKHTMEVLKLNNTIIHTIIYSTRKQRL